MAEDTIETLVSDTLSYIKGLQKNKAKSELPSPPSPAPIIRVIKEAPPPKKIEPVKPKVEPPVLQPMKPKVSEMNNIRSLIGRATPHLFLHSEIPSDHKAKQINTAWQERSKMPEIPLLVSKELAPYGELLKSLAHAIDSVYGGCRVVNIAHFEKGNLWEQVLGTQKLIIIPDVLLSSAKNLLPFYSETPGEVIRKLKGVPLLLLPDLSLYLKDPLLKRSLWNVISAELN